MSTSPEFAAGISIIVPCRDSRETLTLLLSSLHTLSIPPLEIILVDDNSRIPLDEIAAEYKIQYIRIDEDKGPAFARNLGASRATGEVLLFLDADVIPAADILDRINQTFARLDDISAIQGIYAPISPVPGICSRYQNLYYHHAYISMKTDYPAVCSTYCFAIHHAIFNEMGGFDSRIDKPTVEDEIFGYKIAAQGHRIYLDREIKVAHLARYSLWDLIRRKTRMSFYQMKSFLRGNRPPIFSKEETRSRNKTHHSKGFVLSVLLAPMVPLSWCISPWLGCLINLLYILGNGSFWMFLLKNQRFHRFPGFLLLTWIDQVSVFIGIISGFFHFISGEKY